MPRFLGHFFTFTIAILAVSHCTFCRVGREVSRDEPVRTAAHSCCPDSKKDAGHDDRSKHESRCQDCGFCQGSLLSDAGSVVTALKVISTGEPPLPLLLFSEFRPNYIFEKVASGIPPPDPFVSRVFASLSSYPNAPPSFL